MRPQSEQPESTGEVARQETAATAESAKQAAGQVAGTARNQAGQVTAEAGRQARNVMNEARERMGEEAQTQTRRASETMRQWSDELASMAESAKPDSPVCEAVHQIADGGRRAADHLERNGIEGVVGEVQEFARRRPGTFLLGAVAAGFLVGRMAKASASAQSSRSQTRDKMADSDQERYGTRPVKSAARPDVFPPADPYATPEPLRADPYAPSAEPYPPPESAPKPGTYPPGGVG